MSHSSRYVRVAKGLTTAALIALVYLCGAVWNIGVVWVFAGMGCVLAGDVLVDLVRVIHGWPEFWAQVLADAAEEDATRHVR